MDDELRKLLTGAGIGFLYGGPLGAVFGALLSRGLKTDELQECYDELDLDPGATDEEVKSAFRHLVLEYHPDRLGDVGREEKRRATERFYRILQAYAAIRKKRNL